MLIAQPDLKKFFTFSILNKPLKLLCFIPKLWNLSLAKIIWRK